MKEIEASQSLHLYKVQMQNDLSFSVFLQSSAPRLQEAPKWIQTKYQKEQLLLRYNSLLPHKT